jgi:hypothetical protein
MRGFRRGGGIIEAARSVPAVLLAAAGLAALAACGSGQPQTFHPAGAQIAAKGSGAQSGGSGFAASVHLEFQAPLPAQPVRAQVMKADQAFWLAFFRALYSHGTDLAYLSDVARAHGQTVTRGGATLTTGGSYGLSELANDVTNYRAKDHGIEGTVIFSDTTVTPDRAAPGEWDVSGCVNESQLPDTSSSGQVLPNTGSQGQYYYYQTDVLSRGSDGRWLLAAWNLVDQYPAGKALQCMS